MNLAIGSQICKRVSLLLGNMLKYYLGVRVIRLHVCDDLSNSSGRKKCFCERLKFCEMLLMMKLGEGSFF